MVDRNTCAQYVYKINIRDFHIARVTCVSVEVWMKPFTREEVVLVHIPFCTLTVHLGVAAGLIMNNRHCVVTRGLFLHNAQGWLAFDYIRITPSFHFHCALDILMFLVLYVKRYPEFESE